MEAEQLFQMLKETDDPAIRQQIAEEFPADPELKGIFERSYQGYLQAMGKETKKPKLPFRMSHAIGIAACMVLIVGAYLVMQIPQERLPSIIEETTTVTETLETSGEMCPTGTEPTDIISTDTVPSEASSSDMTVSADEMPEFVTVPALTEPAESTAPHASETAVTGGTTQDMQTMTTAADVSETADTSSVINPTTTPPVTSVLTDNPVTTEPTAPVTTEPTAPVTTEPTAPVTTEPTVPMTTEETVLITTEETVLITTWEMDSTEIMTTEYTDNPTEEEMTTTTTTTTSVPDNTAVYAVNRTTTYVTVRDDERQCVLCSDLLDG